MNDQMEKIIAARDFIQSKTIIKPQIAIILGSGLGALANEVQVDAVIPYSQIPGFPVSTVAGHAGQLLLGTLKGKKVAVMQGRFHYYEGYPLSLVVFPVRVLRALGASTLIVTNAAGGLNPDFDAGEVMLITDHINAMGANPLIGPNLDEFGPRFPDMTHAYAPALRTLAQTLAKQESILLRQGVYIACSGPTFETPAERRHFRMMGGDAIGMSTVPEVIVANHAGMQVMGMSAITNKATGGADQAPDSHEEVLAMAAVAGEKLVRLVRRLIEALPGETGQPAPDWSAIIDREPAQIAQLIDHTLLKPEATTAQIDQLCREAAQYGFASVCINPVHVGRAAAALAGSAVKVCTVVGFPLGASTPADKVRETIEVIEAGATEVDMVINIGALKEGNDALVAQDMAGVAQAARSRGALTKVIIEAGLLTDEEKVRACQLAKQSGIDFVKTSTGFLGSGAAAADVALMRQTVGPELGVKASGGIKTLADARNMVAAGANRLGVSAGVQIMQEAQAKAV
jgi:purine-nucleoside phosphorylase